MRSDEQGPQGEDAVKAAIQACKDAGFGPNIKITHACMGNFALIGWNERPSGLRNGARYPMKLCRCRLIDLEVVTCNMEGFTAHP